MQEIKDFSRKIARAVFITLLIVSGFLLLVFYPNFFLLVFAGMFFSVLLNAASNRVAKSLKIKYGLSLALVILFVVGLITGVILLLGPAISQQVSEMTDTLPKSLSNLKKQLSQTTLGEKIVNQVPDNPQDLLNGEGSALSRVTGFFSSTLGVFADFIIILISGIFLASDPKTYKNGFTSLFPVSLRQRLTVVMDKVHHTLTLWMAAKLISMTVVGITTAIGLHLLGIPLPYALALIAALFSFIPNIGPYLALVPALLIAFMQGADKALYVAILYFSIQIVETYLITPFVEKKLVAIPPALALFWMVLFGILAGILGLILATPILAALIIIVGELYVKDYLENKNQG